MAEPVEIITEALHGWRDVALLTAVLFMALSGELPRAKASRWAIYAALVLGGLSALLGLLVGAGVIHA